MLGELVGFFKSRKRLTAYLIGIFVVLIFYDFLSRLIVMMDDVTRPQAFPSRVELVKRLDPASFRGRVERIFQMEDGFSGSVPSGEPIERQLSLKGIFSGSGDRQKASVLIVGATGETSVYRVVAIGENIEGWRVDQIKNREITLSRGPDGESKRLELFETTPEGGRQGE